MSQTPSLGRIVIVTTPIAFSGGQKDCAAIVTGTLSHEQIHVTAFPPGGTPFAIQDVYPDGHAFAGTYSWRWPDRT